MYICIWLNQGLGLMSQLLGICFEHHLRHQISVGDELSPFLLGDVKHNGTFVTTPVLPSGKLLHNELEHH